MEIFENITSDQFMAIFFFSWMFFILHDVICCITNAINERTWIVKDYEQIIYDNVGIYDYDDNKYKKLIANARENVEKRKARRKKMKAIFKKGKKWNFMYNLESMIKFLQLFILVAIIVLLIRLGFQFFIENKIVENRDNYLRYDICYKINNTYYCEKE